jgi:hypothetical protein
MTIKILSPCDGDHYVHVGNTFEKMLVRRQQKLKFFLFFCFHAHPCILASNHIFLQYFVNICMILRLC